MRRGVLHGEHGIQRQCFAIELVAVLGTELRRMVTAVFSDLFEANFFHRTARERSRHPSVNNAAHRTNVIFSPRI
jgi:hypothetical protein